MTDQTPPQSQDGPLTQVGWWCWRGNNHGHLATTACRSDNVPIHVPAEWADEMRAVIQRIEDGDEPDDTDLTQTDIDRMMATGVPVHLVTAPLTWATPPTAPRFTARPVSAEEEAAATARAVKAAADSERSAAWFAQHSNPSPAEEAVTRVTVLYEQWVKAGPPPLGTSINRWWDKRLAELHRAIQPPAGQSKEQP